VSVYDTAAGAELWSSNEIHVERFSSDGKLLALSTGADLVVREAAGGRELQRLRGAMTFGSVVFSLDNRTLFVNDSHDFNKSSQVQVWDLANGRQLRSFPLRENAGSIELSPDGRTLAFQRGAAFAGAAEQGKPSPEASQRLRHILAQLEQSPNRLRALRAMEILEHIATPKARALLSTVADGQPTALITQEAKASLQRLDR
jgi:hypothetical protein